jgi:hypothetical protein
VVFERPNRIDGNLKRIDTPDHWKEQVKEEQIEVLRLVDGTSNAGPGWTSYSEPMAGAPEVEILCGGINSKTPTAAALWRQGNLMHFGFEPSPAEMNENGRALLENAIHYIARFTSDRPIAITPSIFVTRKPSPTRAYAARAFRPGEVDETVLERWFAPEEVERLVALGEPGAVSRGFDEARPFYAPNAEGKLVRDPDLMALGAGADDSRFFDRAREALASPDKTVRARALRLLRRFVPEGPQVEVEAEAAPQEWTDWIHSRKDALFFSEVGGWRWYLDPLAVSRGIPSAALRGTARADQSR